MLLTIDRIAPGEFTPIIDILKRSWEDQPGAASGGGDPDVRIVVDALHKMVPPLGFYTPSDDMTANDLHYTWKSGIAERRPLPTVSSSVSLRHLLNSAWLTRLSEGEEHVSTLGAQIKAICEMVIANESERYASPGQMPSVGCRRDGRSCDAPAASTRT
jgi:hypothetical protein